MNFKNGDLVYFKDNSYSGHKFTVVGIYNKTNKLRICFGTSRSSNTCIMTKPDELELYMSVAQQEKIKEQKRKEKLKGYNRFLELKAKFAEFEEYLKLKEKYACGWRGW